MSVTQPAGTPCIHSTNRDESRGAPRLPGSVGAGAGQPVTRSHRAIGSAWAPRGDPWATSGRVVPPLVTEPGRRLAVALRLLRESPAVGVGSSITADGSIRSPLEPRWLGPPFVASLARGVGRRARASSRLRRPEAIRSSATRDDGRPLPSPRVPHGGGRRRRVVSPAGRAV